MRAFVLLVVAVLGAIGAGIGAIVALGAARVATPAPSAVEVALASLFARPDLQLTVVTTTAHSGSSRTLGPLTFEIEESSNDPSVALAQAGRQIGTTFALEDTGHLVAEVRVVDDANFYFWMDLAALPPTTFTKAGNLHAFKALEPLLDRRWFDLPSSLLHALEARSASSEAGKPSPAALAFGATVLHALAVATTVRTHSGATGGSITASGSIGAVASAVLPALHKLATSLGTPIGALSPKSLRALSGSYALNIKTNLAGAMEALGIGLSTPGSPAIGVAVLHRPVRVLTPVGVSPLPFVALEQAAAALERQGLPTTLG